MLTTRLFLCLALSLAASACLARDASRVNPTFPRIGNCYGAGIGWQTWDKGAEYWSKLDLFIGGGYDLHYDWEHARWPQAKKTIQANVEHLRQVNPDALILPYVDVIEGPDNPTIPKQWWDLNDKGERWSGWPGMFRINTKLPEVLQFNLDHVRDEVFGRECFDGVFYDCWSPDPVLCPKTARLRDGKAIVMLNAWNLPTAGFADLNGVLAEDEINRVTEGKVDFEDFLHRYLRWCTESRKPVTTMLVCHPRGIDDDPWRTAKLTHEQLLAEYDKAHREDEQTMRFGLATMLMGDGYFGYDCGTAGRGNWWWYKEYDAPLGHPKGPASRNADGTWQRAFEGGTVVVNGTMYDAVVKLPARWRDVSTGRVGSQFTLPQFDGRIFLPTTDPPTTTPDVEPRLTVGPPANLRVTKSPDGLMVAQTPAGLELRLDAKGTLRGILWHGRLLMTGGMPVVATPPFRQFALENVTGGLADDVVAPPDTAVFAYKGALVEGNQRAEYVETCTVGPGGKFALRFDVTAITDLDIRMWRHYFAFPVAQYAGCTAQAGGKSLVLPQTLKDDKLLPDDKQFTVTGKGATVRVESSLPLGLIDHRKYGMDEYLLAGYPTWNAVKAGTKLSVEMTVTVQAR